MTDTDLELTTPAGRTARMRHLVEVLAPDGRSRPVPIADVASIDITPPAASRADASRAAAAGPAAAAHPHAPHPAASRADAPHPDTPTVATGRSDDLDARLTVRPSADERILDLELEVTWRGAPAEAGLRLAIDLPGTVRESEPRWLIPGSFYRENRPEGTAVAYPKAVLGPGDASAYESSWWSFRSDRAATTAVFGWTDAACVGLAAEPTTPLGLTGIGFRADDPRPQVWIDLPYREEPVVYRGHPTPGEPAVATHRWAPGETHRFSFAVLVDAPAPHAYDALLRARYAHDRQRHPLNPWMDPAAGAELTAYGLHTWHWKPEHDVFYVTASFDRALPAGDRATMHSAWIGGIPWAHALLAYGRRTGEARYVQAGERVIDHVCSARTPAGTFWGEWRLDRGWGCGWNRDPNLLHARTLAEATLFTIRAVVAERAVGIDRAAWIAAASANLEVAAAAQDADGNLGSYYHQRTGEAVDRSGAAGILWIAALVEGSRLLDRPDLLEVARRAGAFYARFVEDAFINGAPEDVHLAPTSEDAYNALIAYVGLQRADPDDPRWLPLARLAANWMMTFRWSYDVEFGEHTILREYDLRTRGADAASPPNQHLHAYGLVALGELLALWRLTGDGYYLDRARDNLACFLQLIAREDGDFNARRGMATERYYHTDYLQPKGSLLSVSHAWCLGVTLLACQVAMDDPAAFPPGLAWADSAPAPGVAPRPT